MCSKSLSNLSKTQTNWWRLKNSLCAHWSSFKADCNSQINKGSSILWSVSEYLFKTMFQIPESFLYCFHLPLRLKIPSMISWITYITWLVLTYELMEDRHKNDITINSIMLFHHLKQKDPILLWVCTVIDHRKECLTYDNSRIVS